MTLEQITCPPQSHTVNRSHGNVTAVNVFNGLVHVSPQTNRSHGIKKLAKSQLPQSFFVNFVPKFTHHCGNVNTQTRGDIKGVATKAATLLFFYVPAPQVRSRATHPLTGASDCGSAVWSELNRIKE